MLFSGQTVHRIQFLYNRAYLGIVLSYEKGFYDMGVACKLSLPCPFFWKITYSSKKGVATLIYTPRPFPFRFRQRDTWAIIPESFIKLSSPILKLEKFEFWILKKAPILLHTGSAISFGTLHFQSYRL